MSKTKKYETATELLARQTAEQAAEDARLEETGRAYALAWSAYEEARTRFMDMVLHGGTDVPLDERLGHDDLTDAERELILADREATVRMTWGMFQLAQFEYTLAVDGNTLVEQRRP